MLTQADEAQMHRNLGVSVALQLKAPPVVATIVTSAAEGVAVADVACRLW